MDSLADRFHAGQTFDEMLATAPEHGALYRVIRAHAVAPPEFAARIEATGRRWYFLVISEDWCADSVNILPYIDALVASAPRTALRIIARDRNLDLMDRHLTNGRTRSIPIVLVLDDQLIERSWWGPRPQGIQAWFESPEAKALTKEERYKVLRARYAKDRGRSLMAELTALIEEAALQDLSAASATTQASS